MENVNITSIEFDKSMPLWATDETLDKLNKLLVKETQLSRKDINKLTTIVSKIVTQNKSTASDGKNITKEVAKTDKTLNKILSQLSTLNKNIIKANQQSSKTAAAQSSNNNIQNNKNTTAPAKMPKATQSEIKHDVNIRMNQALTQQMAFIHKSVSRHSGIMKQVSTRFDMSIKRMETVVNKQDKLNTKIGGALERMVGIMGSMTKDGIKIKGTINSTEKFKSPNNEVQESKPDGRQAGIMHSIIKRLEAPNRDRDIFNRNSRRVGRNNTKRRTLSPVRGTPKNPALAVLTSFGKVLGTVVKTFRTFANIIGKFNFVGTAVMGAKAIYNAMDDVILERRKMLQSGFSFAKEAEGFDGAKLRLTMNNAGLTMERGFKAMEKNATLVNKLGVQPFLKTIGELTADGGIGSLMGDLGMTIPEIDDYASQYMSTLQRLGDSERLREDKRARATEEFIRQADQMGKVTGLGTKAILDNVLKIQQDVRYRAGYRSLDKVQQGNITALTNMMTAFTGGDENASKAFALAALDPASRGLLGSEEGMNFQVALGQLGMGDIFTKLDDLVINAKNISPEEMAEKFQEITRDIQGAKVTKPQYDQIVMLSQDSKHGAAASMLLNIMDHANADMFKVPEKGDSNLTPTEVKQPERDAAVAKAAADAEKLFSEGLDTDGARALYGDMSDTVKAGAELFSKGVTGLLDGIKIFVDGFKKLLGLLFKPFKRIAGFFGYGSDADEIEEEMNVKSENHQEDWIKNNFDDRANEIMAKASGADDEQNDKATSNDAGKVDTRQQNKPIQPSEEKNAEWKEKNARWKEKNAKWREKRGLEPKNNDTDHEFQDVIDARNKALGIEPDQATVELEQPKVQKQEPQTVEPEQPESPPLPTAVSVMSKEIDLVAATLNDREAGLENLKTLEQTAITENDRDHYRELIAKMQEQISQAQLQQKILLDMLDAIKRDNSMIKNASQ